MIERSVDGFLLERILPEKGLSKGDSDQGWQIAKKKV